jgi:hypothetical protein
MPTKTVRVECPYTEEKPFGRHTLQVQIPSKYKGARAVPQSGELPLDHGENHECPTCHHQLFIIWQQ